MSDVKAKLLFDLSIEDDRIAFNQANNGAKYYLALEELAEKLRAKVKYSEEAGSWETAKELFWQVLHECDVTLE